MGDVLSPSFGTLPLLIYAVIMVGLFVGARSIPFGFVPMEDKGVLLLVGQIGIPQQGALDLFAQVGSQSLKRLRKQDDCVSAQCV